MSEEKQETPPSPNAEVKPKKPRKNRAIFLVLPSEATVGELVRLLPCAKKKDARKALETAGIDITNHGAQVRMVRGEYMPFAVQSQVVFKF